MRGIPLLFFVLSVISAVLTIVMYYTDLDPMPQMFMAVMFALWAIAAQCAERDE